MKIAIVECSKTKLRNGWWKARDLYSSTLFKKSLAHAEKNCDFVLILSSKYGLIHPDTRITHYDMEASQVELVYYGGKKKEPFVHNLMEGMFIGQRLHFLEEN